MHKSTYIKMYMLS